MGLAGQIEVQLVSTGLELRKELTVRVFDIVAINQDKCSLRVRYTTDHVTRANDAQHRCQGQKYKMFDHHFLFCFFCVVVKSVANFDNFPRHLFLRPKPRTQQNVTIKPCPSNSCDPSHRGHLHRSHYHSVVILHCDGFVLLQAARTPKNLDSWLYSPHNFAFSALGYLLAAQFTITGTRFSGRGEIPQPAFMLFSVRFYNTLQLLLLIRHNRRGEQIF